MERVNIDDKQAPKVFGSGEPGRNGCIVKEIEQISFYEFKKDGVYKYSIPNDLVYTKLEEDPNWKKLNFYNKQATADVGEPESIRDTFTRYDYAFEAALYIIVTASFYGGISLLSEYLRGFKPEVKSVLKDLYASNKLAEYSNEMKTDITKIISDFAISSDDFNMNQDNLTNEQIIGNDLVNPSNPERFLENPGLSTLGEMFNKDENQMAEVLEIRENKSNEDSSFFAKVSKNLKQDLGVSILESIGSGDMIYSVDEVSTMDVEKSKTTAAAIYKAAENIVAGYKSEPTQKWTPVGAYTLPPGGAGFFDKP